jgi:hypothetical protein
MHEAVGRAVLLAQVFETMVSICFQFLGMLETGTSTLIDSKRFKEPTRNLIKELAKDNNIAPDFEEQINDLIEKRHLLVHRWYRENGIPAEEDSAHISKLIELARDVEQNSRRISGLLAGYVVRWGRMHPEQNVMAEPERSRLLALFQCAHLGDTGE